MAYMHLRSKNVTPRGYYVGGTLILIALNSSIELEEDQLVSIDTEVDSGCRDDRHSLESLEVGVDENDELRVRVCIDEVWVCRLRPLRRGNRIFRDGVVEAVTVVVGSGERAVESALIERGGGCSAAVGVAVGLSSRTDAFGFLARRRRWLRPGEFILEPV